MTQPNIAFVIFDDLGLADATPTLMPNVTAFGTTGGARVFSRCYSMPVCSQSRASMLYGKYGRTLGIISGMSSQNGPEPAAGADTVASLLKAAGYQTALIGKWHGGRDPVNPHNDYIGAPRSRGFDAWLAGTPDNIDDFFSWPRIDEDGETVLTTETQYAALAQIEAACAWWQATPGPKFMQVSLSIPHGPYHFPPSEMLDGFESEAQSENRRQYESEVVAADWAFGQLMSVLTAEDVICIAGDNGTPNNARAPGQQEGRVKSTCYEGGIRVPMAFRHPSYPGGMTNRLTHIADIPATFLWAAGCPVPTDWDGRSLALTSRMFALSEAQTGDSGGNDLVKAAMDWRYKLLRNNEDAEELYDLQADPGELNKLPLNNPKFDAILYELREVLYG